MNGKDAIMIRVDGDDFDRLCEQPGEFRHIPPESRDRFQDPATGEPAAIGREWHYIYWLGGDYVAVLVARSFLEVIGHKYQVVADEAQHPNGETLGWAILADYASPYMTGREAERMAQALKHHANEA